MMNFCRLPPERPPACFCGDGVFTWKRSMIFSVKRNRITNRFDVYIAHGQYIELALRGDDTIDTRLKMFTHQRDVLLAQMEEMRHTLETVEYKCWYYETAKAAGTIDVPRDMADEDVPERFRAIRRELKTIPQE